MCAGGGSTKVEVPKPRPLPPPLPAPEPPKKKMAPKVLVEPGTTPDIRIGAAKKKGADRSSGRRNSNVSIGNNNQGLNL